MSEISLTHYDLMNILNAKLGNEFPISKLDKIIKEYCNVITEHIYEEHTISTPLGRITVTQKAGRVCKNMFGKMGSSVEIPPKKTARLKIKPSIQEKLNNK